jgi:monothiol glutaredoxin
MAISESLRQQLSDLVARDRVVLFMKGNRHFPQCGFSARVVSILNGLLPSYHTVNVLESPEIREGIKEFSSWPTIPQLYVGGQFVGGCDIVTDMHASGELQKLLRVEVAPAAPPAITVSSAAAAAIQAASGDADGEPLHLGVSPQFQYDLFFGPRSAGDLEVTSNGVTLLIDAASARLAQGISIDFVDGPGGGFKIDNPNAPPGVKQLGPAEAKAMLDRGELVLFDVRPERERAIAKIDVARPLDEEGQAYLMSLDRDTPVAFYCHHGHRSQTVAERVLREGFKKIYNLKGGIEAWARVVDPRVPQY